MPCRVSIPPVVEPLHLTEVKAALRIQHSAEDGLLAGYLTAARQNWEDVCGRALVAQTVVVALDQFPTTPLGYHPWAEYQGAIVLLRSPALAVSSLTYVDSNGTTQTVATSVYTLNTFTEPNWVQLAYGQSWPSARCQPNSVQLTYTAGYATPLTVTDIGNNVLTFAGRAPVADERLRLWNSGGALPAGLSANTDYYVVTVSGQACKLALSSGGSAIDITDAGTGLHFAGEIPREILTELELWVGDMYRNREGGAVQPLKLNLSRNYRLMGVV